MLFYLWRRVSPTAKVRRREQFLICGGVAAVFAFYKGQYLPPFDGKDFHFYKAFLRMFNAHWMYLSINFEPLEDFWST